MLLPSRLNVDVSTEVLEILQLSAHRLLYRADAPMKATVIWKFLKDVRVLQNPNFTSSHTFFILNHISYFISVGAADVLGVLGAPRLKSLADIHTRKVALRSGWLDPTKLPSTVLCQKDLDELARRLAMADLWKSNLTMDLYH